MPLRLNSYVSSTCRGGRPHAAAANRASTQATALVGGDDQLLMISLNADHPGFDDKLVFEEPARRARVNDVLLPQDAGGQAFRRVVRANRYRRLDHDRTVVELGADEMDRAAVQLHACGERARVGVEARERGQQRGMDIEHAALITGDETRREDGHETGEDHEAWGGGAKFGAE